MAWTAAQKQKLSEALKKAWKARRAKQAHSSVAKTAAVTVKSVDKPKAAGGKFTCTKCGRTFAMALHLGRHMSSTHAPKRRKSPQAPQVVAQARSGMTVSAPAVRRGRPPQSAAPTFGNNFTGSSMADLITLRRQIDGELADRIVRGTV
jgi:hypothetical protein